MEWLIAHVVDVLLAVVDGLQSPALGAVLTALGLGAVVSRWGTLLAAVGGVLRALKAIPFGSSSNNPAPQATSALSPSEASPPTPRKRQSSKVKAANDNREMPLPYDDSPFPDQNGN